MIAKTAPDFTGAVIMCGIILMLPELPQQLLQLLPQLKRG